MTETRLVVALPGALRRDQEPDHQQFREQLGCHRRGECLSRPPRRSDLGETKGHAYLAIYKADVNLRLAWGMTVGAVGTDAHLAFKTGDFADPSIERQLVDGFWRGALVTRSSVLSADGHRCYLPIPEFTFSARVADPPTVKTSEVALARLLNRLARRDARDLDARLERAEVVVVPD